MGWKVIKNDLGLLSVRDPNDRRLKIILSATREGHQAGLTPEQAHLIASAVNACIGLNPDNPQAVAESIPDLMEVIEWIKGFKHTRKNLTWITIPHYDWQAKLKERGIEDKKK